jgi:hypothetical protein
VATYGLLGRIWRIDPSGGVHDFVSGLTTPSFLRFGPGGGWGEQLYVCENIANPSANHGRILRIDAAGAVTDIGDPTPPELLFAGGDIAFSDTGPYGNALYVGISGGFPGDGISKFVPPAGVFHVFQGEPGVGHSGTVSGLAFGPATAGWTGELYAALEDHYLMTPAGVPLGGIYRVSTLGDPTPIVTTATEPRVQKIHNLAFTSGGAWGTVMLASIDDRILRITSGGTVTDFVTGIRNRVSVEAGIMIAFDGLRLWFVEPATRTLWRLSPETLDVPRETPGSGTFTAIPRVTAGITQLDYAVAASAGARLECFDVTGRRVRQWSIAGATGRISWDGTDDTGARVPAGLYFARLTAGACSLTARIVRVH